MFKSTLKITTILLLIFLLFNKNYVFSQNNAADVIHTAQINTNIVTPVRICLDKEDNLYIADNNKSSIVKYDNSNTFLESFVLDFSPLSIAVNNDFQLFIGDKQSGKIYKKEDDGTISLFYSGCIFPTSMTFSPDGLLYIVDSYLKEVVVLDISANVVKRFGSETLVFPSSIAYDSRNQRVIVGEHGGIGTGFTPTCKVWVFDLQGKLLSSFGSYGGDDGEFYRIHGLTIGKCGNIYVSESYQASISVFDETGTFITKFGEYGELTGQLNIPLDIAFDSQERILICSMNNGAVDIYNVTDNLPTANIRNSDTTICSGETTEIQIELTGTAPWTYTYTIDGLNSTLINTSNAINILTVTNPGIYEITQLSDATQSGTCFTGSATIQVTNIIPTANISGGNTIICEGENTDIQIDMTGEAPWTFAYTVDGLTPKTIKTTNNPYLLSVDVEGLYQLTEISGKGCVGTEFTGSAEISILPLPTSAFEIGNNAVDVCEGNDVELIVNLTGTSPWSFSFMVDETDTTEITNILYNQYTLSSSLIGSYEIIQINDVNCTNYSTIGYPDVRATENSIPDFNFEVNNNNVVFFNNSQYADSYFWDFGDGFNSSETNPAHTYEGSGIFTVNLLASNTICGEFSTFKFLEITNSDLVNLIFEENIKIYPKPSFGTILINLKNIDISTLKVEISNIIGQNIYSNTFNNSRSILQIDLMNYNSGMHFITISSDKNSLTQMIMLNK